MADSDVRDTDQLETAAPALPASLMRVARCAAEGFADKEIAAALGMPLATVRTYVRRIYGALGVDNRVALRIALGR